MIKIRKMENNDFMPVISILHEQISPMYGNYTLEEDMKYLKNEWKKYCSGSSLVAEENGKIVGYISIIFTDNYDRFTPFVYSIAVTNDYQSKGVGSKLVDAACTALKEKGYSNVELTVLIKNERAANFYEKNGFSKIKFLMEKKF